MDGGGTHGAGGEKANREARRAIELRSRAVADSRATMTQGGAKAGREDEKAVEARGEVAGCGQGGTVDGEWTGTGRRQARGKDGKAGRGRYIHSRTESGRRRFGVAEERRRRGREGGLGVGPNLTVVGKRARERGGGARAGGAWEGSSEDRHGAGG